MAEAKIKDRDWILSVSEDGGTTYKPVACLISKELSTSRAPIDANSNCGNEMLVGDIIEQSISAEGHSITETGTPAKVSATKLYELLTENNIIDARLRRAVPVSGTDVKYEGKMIVSELTQNGSDGDTVKFNVTLTAALPPLTQTVEA